MTSSLDLHGSITAEEKTFIETWENVAQGTNYIVQENRRGDEVHTAITGQGRRFRLSTYERMLTEERCLEERNNPFKNGSFRPVTVPTGIDIKSNPNALSDEDINRLFVASDVAWDEYMAVLDAPATLARMIELAENSHLSLMRYRQLEQMHSRFTNLNKRVAQNKDPEIQRRIDAMDGAPPPKTTAIKATSSTARPS